MCILAAVTLRCSTGVPGVGLGDGCRHRGHLPFSGADGCEGCEADVVGGPAPPRETRASLPCSVCCEWCKLHAGVHECGREGWGVFVRRCRCLRPTDDGEGGVPPDGRHMMELSCLQAEAR